MIDRQEVINAFAKTPRPSDRSLCGCACEECQWEIARFKGKTWSRLQLDDFGAEDGGANVAFLTAEAFRYFLPGLLLLVLDNQDAVWLFDRVVGRLAFSDRDEADLRARVDRDITGLSSRQRHVLIGVLRHLEPLIPHAPVVWQSLVASLHNGSPVPYNLADLEAHNLALLKRSERRQDRNQGDATHDGARGIVN